MPKDVPLHHSPGGSTLFQNSPVPIKRECFVFLFIAQAVVTTTSPDQRESGASGDGGSGGQFQRVLV